MGTNYYAYAIIGLKVPRDKIIGTKIVHKNKCTCEPQTDPTAGQKFCGKCGENLDRSYRVNDARFVAEECEIGEERIRGWPIVSEGEYGAFYIGIVKAYHKNEKPIPIQDYRTLTVVGNKFKSDMEELGLWDPDAYGLWSVLQIS